MTEEGSSSDATLNPYIAVIGLRGLHITSRVEVGSHLKGILTAEQCASRTEPLLYISSMRQKRWSSVSQFRNSTSFVQVPFFTVGVDQELVRVTGYAPMAGPVPAQEGIQPVHSKVGILVAGLRVPAGTIRLGAKLVLKVVSRAVVHEDEVIDALGPVVLKKVRQTPSFIPHRGKEEDVASPDPIGPVYRWPEFLPLSPSEVQWTSDLPRSVDSSSEKFEN